MAQIRESGEMYLETILILSKKKNIVRAIDIVEEMEVSKPSVSRALAKLKKDQFIIVDNDGYIAFTESGRSLAQKIYERHTVLTKLLEDIGVDSETARTDACRIEHYISDKSFEAIKKRIS
jgi:Mn-dependent DtxR family transcriptional regulator